MVDDPRAIHLAAPLDFGARWDTSEFNVSIGVIRQRPANGRYGFPFHEACWSLLERAYSPDPIPERRLFDICRSLPFSNRIDCVTWDHDFGGLISTDDDSYPWEDLFVSQDLSFARFNPYFVSEIQQLPHETPSLLDLSMAMSKSADVFAKIPLEIIMSISIYLPTVDYLNARLALRSFYPVFHTQKFWASRFLPNAERSWVFESQDWAMTCDWLWLYRRTADGSPGMKNRERVWRLVKKVEHLLRLKWTEPISHSITEITETQWLKGAGDVRAETDQPYQGFGGGCREFHEKHVQIPPGQLSQLAFSLIQTGDATFITGIRFVLHRGEVIRLGYMADEEHIRSITHLTGFHLAVGSRGIQAIQRILDNHRELPWVGCPGNAPKTKRLSFAGPQSGFKAGFDVSSVFCLEFVANQVGLQDGQPGSRQLHPPRTSQFVRFGILVSSTP